jgi:hypothetical protein
MPPYPSSPGSPNVSCSVARARSKASIGSRRRATMKEAKSDESGQPCVTPSSMRSWRHVPLDHFLMYSVCIAVEECGEW